MLLVIRSRFLQVLERRFQLALSFSSAHIAFLFVSQSQKFSSYEFSNICIMHNRENFPWILKNTMNFELNLKSTLFQTNLTRYIIIIVI